MAMSVGRGRGGLRGDINMTPMIDVLLVLLIIFMVIQAGLRRGIDVQVPPPKQAAVDPDPPPDPIVLDLQPGGRYFLNRQPVAPGRLAETLRSVYAGRPRKVLFVKGAETLKYQELVTAVDASREAGVQVISLVPRT